MQLLWLVNGPVNQTKTCDLQTVNYSSGKIPFVHCYKKIYLLNQTTRTASAIHDASNATNIMHAEMGKAKPGDW